jgi:hypothetical protein
MTGKRPTATPPATTTSAPDDGQAAMLERVVVGNDLSQLTPKERLAYYRQLCASLNLNPLTRPFQYLYLSNRLTLYATKDLTEQLRSQRGVSVTRLEHTRDDDDTLTVTAYGHDRTGRDDVSTGVVSLAGLRGEARANARMKCETKAKRRLTLSLCGLGVLDESEVDSISVGGRVDVDHDTGEIRSDLKRDALAESEPGPGPGAPSPESERMLDAIKTGFSLLGLARELQEDLWRGFCGPATFLTLEAEPDQLRQLLEHLRARHRSGGRDDRTG